MASWTTVDKLATRHKVAVPHVVWHVTRAHLHWSFADYEGSY
jgi:hypothetical protein